MTKKQIFTYFVQPKRGGLVKIGRSVDPKARLVGLQTASPVELRLLDFLPGDRESELHDKLAKHRAHGEWFYPTQETADVIRSLCANAKVIVGMPVAEDVTREELEVVRRRRDRQRTKLEVTVGGLTQLVGGEWYEVDCDLDWLWRVMPSPDHDDPHHDDDPGLCSCEGCEQANALITISQDHIPAVIGWLWREDGLLCVVFRSQPFYGNHLILQELQSVFWSFDLFGITLQACSLDVRCRMRWFGVDVLGYEGAYPRTKPMTMENLVETVGGPSRREDALPNEDGTLDVPMEVDPEKSSF